MNFKNTKKQGDFGLGRAIAYFTQTGDTVSIPLSDSQDYDLVVDIDGVMNRIQVKSCNRYSDDTYEIDLRISGGNSGTTQKFHDELKYDLLFITVGNGDEYLIPRNVISELKCTITVGKKYREYLVNGCASKLESTGGL